MPTVIRSSLLAAFLVRAAVPALGQANQNPLVDVQVVQADRIQVVGRVGTYPSGASAFEGLAHAHDALRRARLAHA